MKRHELSRNKGRSGNTKTFPVTRTGPRHQATPGSGIRPRASPGTFGPGFTITIPGALPFDKQDNKLILKQIYRAEKPQGQDVPNVIRGYFATF